MKHMFKISKAGRTGENKPPGGPWRLKRSRGDNVIDEEVKEMRGQAGWIGEPLGVGNSEQKGGGAPTPDPSSQKENRNKQTQPRQPL